MKIVVIGTVSSAILGFRKELIQEMLRCGHEVYAFAMDYTAESAAKVTALGAVPVSYKLSRGALTPMADVLNTIRLRKEFLRIRPDVVFSFFAKPVVFATIAAALARVKRRVGMLEGLGSVFTEHPKSEGFKQKILKAIQISLYRISFRYLSAIVFLNKDDPVDLLDAFGIAVRRVEVLGAIGLNLSSYSHSVAPVIPVTFIFVGRLIAEKGICEFVDAARLVKANHPQARFVVLGRLDLVGRRSISAEYLDECVREGLIIYPGHVPDVTAWIEDSSVFVLPSYYREGVPRSTQEAMALGRAIISTDVPGCRETVIDGVNGFLVPKWQVDKLAEKMSYFCVNNFAINEMGRKSREIAEARFDSNAINARLLKIIEGV